MVLTTADEDDTVCREPECEDMVYPDCDGWKYSSAVQEGTKGTVEAVCEWSEGWVYVEWEADYQAPGWTRSEGLDSC